MSRRVRKISQESNFLFTKQLIFPRMPNKIKCHDSWAWSSINEAALQNRIELFQILTPYQVRIRRFHFPAIHNINMGNQLSVNYPEHNNPSSSQRRELYLMATRRRVDVNRGTPYPCTQADLDSCARLASRNNAQYITPNLATNELVRWLDHDPDAVAVAALHRLRKGLKIIPWNPDIIIKAFRDLDAAFFKCTLIGNTELAWVGKTARLLRFGFMSCWGTTIKIGHARCRIELNAYKILLETNPYQQMWRTLLHEMVVSHLFIFFNNQQLSSLPMTPFQYTKRWPNPPACISICQMRTLSSAKDRSQITNMGRRSRHAFPTLHTYGD